MHWKIHSANRISVQFGVVILETANTLYICITAQLWYTLKITEFRSKIKSNANCNGTLILFFLLVDALD